MSPLKDPEQMTDDELMAAYSRRQQAEQVADRYMPALIQRESGGRPGVLGPPTPYGRAEGATQMLPATARATADRLGMPWRPELMRATTPEAADYQKQLGREYFMQGYEETGNERDALRYFHGGPDKRLWGPKTEAYANAIAGQGGAPGGTPEPDPEHMTDEQLMAAYQAAKGGGGQEPPLISDESGLPVLMDLKPGSGARMNPEGGIELDINQGNVQRSPQQMLADQEAERQAAGQFTNDTDRGAAKLLDGATYGTLATAGAGLDAAKVGIANLFGRGPGYGMSEAFKASEAATRGQEHKFDEANPIGGAALSMAGSFLNPLTYAGGEFIAGRNLGEGASVAQKLLAGRGLPAMAGRSAAVGAGTGAVFGAGEADGGVADRLLGGAKGALTGGLVGGALPPVIAGAAGGLKRAGGAMSESAQRILGVFGREGSEPTAKAIARAEPTALDYVAGLARRGGPDALNKPDLEAAGATAAEAIGRPAMSQIGAIARRDGATGDLLESSIRQRAQALPQDIVDDFSGVTGLSADSLAGDHIAHAATLREKARPLYDTAYALGESGVDSPPLRELANTPAGQQAMQRAVRIAANERRDPRALGFEIRRTDGTPTVRTVKTPDERELYDFSHPLVPRKVLPDTETQVLDPGVPENALVEIKKPTLQTWDYVKRGLDDVLEAKRDPTSRRLNLDEDGRAILGVLNDLRSTLTDPATSTGSAYRRALDAGGEPLRLEEAFKDARKLVGPGVTERVFNDRWAKFTPAQQESARGGFVSSLYDDMRAGKLKLRDMQAPAVRAKLGTMFGDEQAAQIAKRLEARTLLARTGSRISPGVNSPTYEYLAADQDRQEATGALVKATGSAMKGDLPGAALRLLSAPVAGAYRGAQAPMDRATRDAVGRLLAMRPSELSETLAGRVGAPAKAPVSKRVAALLGSRDVSERRPERRAR